MAEFGEENNNVFGGVEFEQPKVENAEGISVDAGAGEATADETVFKKVEAGNLPVKQSPWTKIKNFLFQEVDLMKPIRVELTPYQQKIEDEINEFLHQEITFKSFFGLFKKQK